MFSVLAKVWGYSKALAERAARDSAKHKDAINFDLVTIQPPPETANASSNVGDVRDVQDHVILFILGTNHCSL